MPDLNSLPEELKQRAPVFVTLHHHGHLRGCVGSIEARAPLAHEVMETAVAAAINDPRFPPLSEQELPDLSLQISILTPFQRVKDFSEIIPGRHGLLVKRDLRRGLFLPQVWRETGWDKQQFMEELCEMKAGIDPSVMNDLKTAWFTFEVDSFSDS